MVTCTRLLYSDWKQANLSPCIDSRAFVILQQVQFVTSFNKDMMMMMMMMMMIIIIIPTVSAVSHTLAHRFTW